jgi:hypothetical protein
MVLKERDDLQERTQKKPKGYVRVACSLIFQIRSSRDRTVQPL